MQLPAKRGDLLLASATRVAATLLLAGGLGCAPARPPAPTPETLAAPSAQQVATDVAWLADPAREGRGLGTAGLAAAAAYLAGGFHDAGLAPAGDAGSYLQRFELPVSVRVESARLALGDAALRRGRDFQVASESSSGALRGAVAFGGYGAPGDPHGGGAPDARPAHADGEGDATPAHADGTPDATPAHADGAPDATPGPLAGRFLLLIDAAPPDAAGPAAPGRLGRAAKLAAARRLGAAAVLFAPPLEGPGELVEDAGPGAGNPLSRDAGLPVLDLSREAADRIAAAAGAGSFAALARRAPALSSAAPLPLPGVELSLSIRIERPRGQVANVVGMLPGADPVLSRQWVVIGAHYDHLGRGAFGSLAPERRGEIHPGADDNASGAAGLLALARAFGAGPRPARSLLFVAFTAEEAGLAGSARFVEANPKLTAAITAMLNLDMIGRLGDRKLVVFGAESGAGLRERVERAAAAEGLPVAFEDGLHGPSDHTSFQVKRVPALMFHTGLHAAYHTPDDRAEAIDAEGEARVLRVVERVASGLLADPERVAFQGETAPPPGAPPAGAGYGPYLGTVPAFGGEAVDGVQLAGVRPGSPAERAGLRAGDVLVEFAGTPVRNLEEFAALLFAERAGATVELVLLRDGRRVRTQAVLGRRR